ncbi:hypothetical protein C2845_PM07G13630 [Panicum miliaceum]|uniref:Uncharacterized protein n=1 Tax=Panicum miliaceum TaxID=4540 RepID=A0A3L6SLB0_PANMI|nr:hypothetical protein C2845_PM07G13630 [Panicum miliaceum]
MVFDLNSLPPDPGEAFTNMTEEPLYELPFPIHAALPDLNEEPLDEEQLFQFHEAQEAQLVGFRVIPGGQNEGISLGKFFQDFAMAVDVSVAAI